MDKITAGIFVVLILAVGYLLLFPASSQASSETTMQKIVREGKIKACYIIDPPFVIKNPNSGELTGQAIDAMNYIASEANLKVEYSESSWGTLVASLQSKQCDVIVTDLYTKIQRASAVSFTRPFLYKNENALVKKDETRLKSIKDLNQSWVRVAVLQGEAGYYFAQKNLQQAQLIVLPGSDLTLPMAMVSSGQADVTITDAWTIDQYAKVHPETQDFLSLNPETASINDFPVNPVGWPVRQEDQSLLSFFNTALDFIDANGKWEEWEKKYDAYWLRTQLTLVKGG